MTCDVNRNKLLYLLLFKNRLFIEQVVSEIGPQNKVLDYVSELNNLYKKEINISITYDTLEIILNIIDEESFYKHMNRINIHDFNDLHCRIAYLLNELINKDDYLNIMDLSDYMNVSRSTVNNDLKRVKEVLKKYNAEIIGIPNKGIKLKCNEFNKRLVLIYEVFDYFPCSIYFDKELMAGIDLLARHYSLNYFTEILLYKVTSVSIERMKNGNELNITVPMYKNFEINNNQMKDFIEQIRQRYKIIIDNEEVNFIAFPINVRNCIYTDTIDNIENEELLCKIVSQMLENVSEKFMIHIDEKEFFEKANHHLLFLINRLFFKIPVIDIFYDQIGIRFPLAFEIAKISINVLYEKYNLVCTKVDISYLAIYFALILDKRKIVKVNSKIANVAIVTNGSRGAFELIKKQLLEQIGGKYKIDFLSISDLSSKNISQYGIIFSTENISSNFNLPIIQINGIIDQDSLNKKIIELEERKLNSFEDILETVELKIVQLDGQKGYKNNVKAIIDNLIEQGKASHDTYSIFEKRDSVSSMIYKNGIAFPHLTDKVINKLSLTLGIINPETDNLKIIFFLLIPEYIDDRQEDTLMKIYDQIFTIISENNHMDMLRSVSSVNDLRIIFNERKLLV